MTKQPTQDKYIIKNKLNNQIITKDKKRTQILSFPPTTGFSLTPLMTQQFNANFKPSSFFLLFSSDSKLNENELNCAKFLRDWPSPKRRNLKTEISEIKFHTSSARRSKVVRPSFLFLLFLV